MLLTSLFNEVSTFTWADAMIATYCRIASSLDLPTIPALYSCCKVVRLVDCSTASNISWQIRKLDIPSPFLSALSAGRKCCAIGCLGRGMLCCVLYLSELCCVRLISQDAQKERRAGVDNVAKTTAVKITGGDHSQRLRNWERTTCGRSVHVIIASRDFCLTPRDYLNRSLLATTTTRIMCSFPTLR